MKNNKYKILVLSKLNETTNDTLKSSLSLAKIVDADINFLYVKKPTEVVKSDNQLSAVRAINEDYLSTNKKISDLIKPISENYNVNINQTYIIGNLKNEIGKYIDDNKPDIIILGKRKSKGVSFIGDNITQFILKKHKGPIVIVHNNNVLEPNKELHIGLFNSTRVNSSITDKIINSTQKPLKSFTIEEEPHSLKEELSKKTVEYVFVKGDNVLKNISNYLSKSKIDLLFVDRKKTKSINTNIKAVINTLDCSLIITT
ncbi:MAG TPA: universal stress protein [Flavobacteriaceae bacterium]|jgi:nucleotide-binding universal stress UspA family protein|nr:universal stress protein [Flavobacteriaceae bacterium]